MILETTRKQAIRIEVDGNFRESCNRDCQHIHRRNAYGGVRYDCSLYNKDLRLTTINNILRCQQCLTEFGLDWKWTDENY